MPTAPAKEYIDYTKGSGIYKYSLCLTPGNPQPSGSLNFSNLETAELKYRLIRKTPFAETTVLVSSPYKADPNGNFDLNDNVQSFDDYQPNGSLNLSPGDRVLLKNQPNPAENGIYVVQGDLKLLMDEGFKNLVKKGPVLVKIVNDVNAPGKSDNNGKTFITYLKNGIITLQDVIVEEYSDASGTIANKFDLQSKVLTIYAVNHNILRIMSGMSSVLFQLVSNFIIIKNMYL